MDQRKGTAPPPYDSSQRDVVLPPQEPTIQTMPYPKQVNGYPPQPYPVGSTNTVHPPAGNIPGNSTVNMTVVSTQPQFVPHNVEPENDYLVLSICSLFCCLFIGIFAVLKSVRSREEYRRGDYDGSFRTGRVARNLAIAAIVVGIICIIISIVRTVLVLSSIPSNQT